MKPDWVVGPTDVLVFEKKKITLQLEDVGDDKIVVKDGWKIIPMNQLEVGMHAFKIPNLAVVTTAIISFHRCPMMML